MRSIWQKLTILLNKKELNFMWFVSNNSMIYIFSDGSENEPFEMDDEDDDNDSSGNEDDLLGDDDADEDDDDDDDDDMDNVLFELSDQSLFWIHTNLLSSPPVHWDHLSRKTIVNGTRMKIYHISPLTLPRTYYYYF